MESDFDYSDESAQNGREAIESLEKLIEAVENDELWGFSDKQAMALVRVAKVLIAAVDKETTVWESKAKSGLLAKLKKAMEKLIEENTKAKAEPDYRPSAFKREALEISTRRCDK